MKGVIVLFAVMGILISFAPCSKANPPDGLVLHLSFDENAIQGDTVKDQSEEGNDGTINGDPQKWSQGSTAERWSLMARVPLLKCHSRIRSLSPLAIH